MVRRAPSRASGSSRAMAPPVGGQDDAGAGVHDAEARRPPAGWLAASQARTTSPRKPCPGRAGLGEHLVAAVAVEADRRRRTTSTGAWPRPASSASAEATVCVPSTREARICCLYAGVQRWSPTPAPARWTTRVDAVEGARVERRGWPGPTGPRRPARGSRRTRRTTSSPRAVSDGDEARRRSGRTPGDGDALRHEVALEVVTGQRPRSASKAPSSRRSFIVVRKRAASAPSTMRWS